MKISIDVECTPAEARAFFGLPDVAPLQERFMAEAEARLKSAVETMDTDALMKAWMPSGPESLDKMQKAFWSAFSGGAGGGKDKT